MPSTRGPGRAPSAVPAALAVMLAASSAGCATRRELVIRSDPPGALVRLDDTVVGTTPYTTRFEAYGTRRITLYKEGYRTRSEVEEIDPPWYGYFPLDVVSEILLPFGWRDEHAFDYRLEPESGTVTMPDLQGVLHRAEALRLAEPTGPRPVLPPPRTGTDAPPGPDGSPSQTPPGQTSPAQTSPAQTDPPVLPVPPVPPVPTVPPVRPRPHDQ